MRFSLEKRGVNVGLVVDHPVHGLYRLLTFRADGRIVRADDLPPNLGFQVDEQGRVIIRGH